MSYNNNWVRSLSESYVNNNRPSDLQEELNEQVYLNENLLEIIEALCEELGIDVEELLSEDVFDLESAKVSRKRVKKARIAADKVRPYPMPGHPVRDAMDAEEKRHKEMGSSDTIFKHNPVTGGFDGVGELPKGAAQAAAGQGQRHSSGSKMSKKQASGLRKAAKKHGGIVASARWEDPEVDPLDMDTVIPKKRRTGGSITKPSANAREWGRG